MNSNHLFSHANPTFYRPLFVILTVLSFFLIFNYFSIGQSKASDASYTDVAAEKASGSKAAQQTNKKGILKKTAAKSSDQLTLTPQGSTTSTGLFMINGSGSGTANGDYTSDQADGLNTYYRYFIEVPAGLSRLAVDLFDADIGAGGSGEAAAGRDRARGSFDSSVTYSLINPAGQTRNVQFTTGNTTGPAGADNAWLSLFDSTGETMLDTFTTAAYNNNNGTVNWAGNWIETSDDNSATGGDIQITGGELSIEAGTARIEREANLSSNGFTSATLTFNLRTVGVEIGDQMRVEVSANGGSSWTTLETFTGSITSGSSRTYNITSSIATNTRIRFIEFTGYGNNDFFLVDNVQIKEGSTVDAGHWELRIDMSSAVTSGDDINAIGIRAHDGTSGAGGTELNVYLDSMMEIGVNPPTSGTNSRSYTLYPYVTSGCNCSKNDFDYDSNSGSVGSMSFTSRSGGFTQNYTTSSLSTNNTWRRDAFSGYTTDASAIDYGTWSSTISISSYVVSGNPNGNYVTYYMGNYQTAANPPAANPVANSFRIYLPRDDGTKPAKAYLTQTFALFAGINPPQVGSPTRYTVTVSVVNPTASAITFSAANVVTANVPGGGTVYRDASTVSQGSITSEPALGGTGNVVWNPGAVAAGATATLTYRVDVTPTSVGQRIPLTATPASGNGTRGQAVDETGNTTQARATYLLGPLCEIAVTSNAPTAVDLIDFTATEQENGVLLEWKTGFEADNLGFRIHREEGGKRSPVNSQLIAGSSLTAGYRSVLKSGEYYAWLDKVTAQGAMYWLEDIDLNGTSKWHGPFAVQAAANHTSGAGSKQPVAKLLDQLNDEASQIESSKVVEKTASFASPARAAVAQNIVQSSLATQNAVKISVKQEGWYRVTQPELVRAGLDAKSNAGLFQLSVDGREVPMKVLTNKDGRFDETSAIEFYGLGLNTPSTNARMYWLSVGSQAGLRVQSITGEGSPIANSGFTTTVERKDRTIYFSSLRNGEQENFFGAVVVATPVNQELRLANVDLSATKQAELEVAIQGVTQVPHRVTVQFNGVMVGDLLFSGQQQGVNKFAIQPSLLKEGANTVQLLAVNSPSDVNLVDYIRLTYQHTFVADDNSLKLNVNGKERVTIDGFTNKAIRVFDVSNESNVKELIGEILESRNGYSIAVTSNDTGQRKLLALTDEKAKTAASIKENRSSNWRTQNQGADFIIITTKEFFPALEALKMVRQSEGYTTALVDIEDVYDEYSFGQKSPQAIKDFLAFAKSSWKIKPAYLLLAADASFDSKNYLGRGDFDFVPTKLIDTNYLETATDDWFADFNNDGISDLAVGRLPIRSLAEANTIINKILSYDKSSLSQSVLLVSDANDGFNFEQASSQLRSMLPGTLPVTEIKRGQVDAATAKQQLLDAINQGQKLVNYAGHGSVNLWRGNLLTSEEAKALKNEGRLPMFVLMTCLNGYFQDPVLDSLGESLLKAENGGAVAVWASSALTEPAPQAMMNQELYRLLFQTRNIGEAILKAKNSIADSDVRRTWILLGDPTMKLN